MARARIGAVVAQSSMHTRTHADVCRQRSDPGIHSLGQMVSARTGYQAENAKGGYISRTITEGVGAQVGQSFATGVFCHRRGPIDE